MQDSLSEPAITDGLTGRAWQVVAAIGAAQALGRRHAQEDNVLLHSTPAAALLIVADGMGGMTQGAAASQAATAAAAAVLNAAHPALAAPAQVATPTQDDPTQTLKLPETVQTEFDEGVTALLVAAVAAAQRAVVALATTPQGRGPGSTLAILLITPSVLSGVARAHTASLGDTRIYLLRNGALRQLSHDHSGAAALVAAGLLTPEAARSHPAASELYRYLGGSNNVAVADYSHLTLAAGDRLLLASDGLWGVLDDGALAALLAPAPDAAPAAVAQTLVAAAADAGGEDNISAALVWIG